MLTNKFKDNIFEKLIILLFLITSIFLISISLVVGQVLINESSIDVPASIDENNDASVSFIATSDTTSDIDYSIYLDGILLSNSNIASTFFNYSSSGDHTFSFYASDNESYDSATIHFEVIDFPIILTLNSPTNNTYDSRDILINVATSNHVDACIYRINNLAFDSLTGVDQYFYQDINLEQDGTYILTVNCSNDFDSAIITSTFTIDSIIPIIVSKSYDINTNNVVTINAQTDVNCICRYDTEDISYDLMSSFTNTNGLQHSVEINGLNEGSYTYYIKCKGVNNVAETESLSFNIATVPSARIYLSKSSPIKAGTYEVNLVTSRSVSAAPTLYYNLDNDASNKYVTLTGSGKDWNGYLIIEEDTPNRIGTFHYSATDVNNNVGTLITEGEIFLVDTLKPIPPSSMTAFEESNGNIKLKWYYDGETVHKYNLYRSTDGNPEYVDYYDSSSTYQYIDKDVIDGVIYYYRIAAVDDADNDGELSNVIEATSNRIVSDPSSADVIETPEISQSLDNGLVPKVNQLTTELNNYLTDIDAVKTEMDGINDPNKLKIINILQLSENTKLAQSTIKGLIDNANALKNQNLKISELDIQLNKLRMEAIKAKTTVAEDLIVSEQSEYDQTTQESDVDSAISEVLNVNLSRNVLNNYSLTNKQMQDNIEVQTSIYIFKIKYLAKDDYDKYTLVKKIVLSSKDLTNISIIEMIPKSFETKASDIFFDIDSQVEPTIVKDDPVLRWDLNIFNKQTIYYMINNNAEMSSAKATKTIVLYTPNFKVSQTIETDTEKKANLLTGLVGLEIVNISNLSLIQWMVILGIGMILGLSAYYVALDKKEKRNNNKKLKDHKIIMKNPMKTVSSTMSATTVNSTHMLNMKTSSASAVSTNPTATPSTSSSSVFNAIKSGNLKMMTIADINQKLDQANNFINNFDYENARILYNECMKSYPSISFKNAAEKNNVKLMLDHISQKITVYRIIYSSRKHINSKNYSLLKQDIAVINKICNKLYQTLSKIDEDNIMVEKKFVDYVLNSKRHLEAMSM